MRDRAPEGKTQNTRREAYALAITTGGNASTFAFFLLGVPAPLPFFPGPVLGPGSPVLLDVISSGGAGGPGVAGGMSPSADGPGAGAGGFALLFFLVAFPEGATLLIVPRGPILACEALGASSGMTTVGGSSWGADAASASAGLTGMDGSEGTGGGARGGMRGGARWGIGARP